MFSKRNLDAHKKALLRLPRNAREELAKANSKSVEEFERYAHALVPVRDGHTKRSIEAGTYELPNGNFVLTMTAGDGTDLAPARAVEFVNDQPFFYPTLRLFHKRWKGRVKRAINKAAKQAAMESHKGG